MDAVRNPFAPGAGSRPPELAGRETILQDAHTAIQRALLGKPSRSQMLLGLRGVGKTVLLNKIEEMAEAAGHVTSAIEAPEGKSLSELLVPKINQALRKLSTTESAKAQAKGARPGPVSLCLMDPALPGEVDMDLGVEFPLNPQIKGALKSLPGVVQVEEV